MMTRLCVWAVLAMLPACDASKFENHTKYGAKGGQLFGSYLVDWAHYRSDPYKWSAADLAPVSVA